jgi:hypothetical protein
VRLWGRLEVAFVSYWEWFKLCSTGLLISCGMTGAVAAVVWWVAI